MTGLTRSTNKFFDWLYKIQTFIAVFSLAILCAMILLQVFLRYVLHAPLFGIEELELFPIIWIYVFGGAMASYEKTHIQCGIAGVFFKDKNVLYIFDLLRDLATLIISVVICYWVFDYFVYCQKIWKLSGVLHLPLFFAEGAIFLGLLIMALFALRDVIETILVNKKTIGGEN